MFVFEKAEKFQQIMNSHFVLLDGSCSANQQLFLPLFDDRPLFFLLLLLSWGRGRKNRENFRLDSRCLYGLDPSWCNEKRRTPQFGKPSCSFLLARRSILMFLLNDPDPFPSSNPPNWSGGGWISIKLMVNSADPLLSLN